MKLADRFKAAAAALRGDFDWDVFKALVGAGSSKSGVAVNKNSALGYSPVWRALVLISQTLSTVPLQTFQRTDRGRQPYRDHPLYDLLHDQANPIQSAQQFREQFWWNVEIQGIGLAEKVHTRTGKLRQLWNISPEDLTDISVSKDKLLFHFSNGQVLGPDKVFYCYGPGSNGLQPRSPITVARESLGLGMAAEQFGSRFFGQGTHLGGFVEHDSTLKPESYERLKSSINEKYQGLGNSHKVIILEHGMKFKPAGFTNEDSQFLQTRKFQVEEVARWFGLQPHLIQDLERSTFSNIEHQGIEAVTYSWRPKAVRLEQAINAQLLTPEERKRYYVEHNLDGLMRGDLQAQAQVWSQLAQAGVLNANEIRQWMNMNDQEGEQGKIYFMPMNMSDKSQAQIDDFRDKPQSQEQRKNIQTEIENRSIAARRRIALSFRRAMERRSAELVNYDISLLKQVNSAYKDDYYKGEYKEKILAKVQSTVGAVSRSMAQALYPALVNELGEFDEEEYEAFTERYVDSEAKRYYLNGKRDIDGVDFEDEDAIKHLKERWQESRASLFAGDELTQCRNALFYTGLVATGRTKIKWRNFGGAPCPYCEDLDGKVVGVTEPFLAEGTEYQPEGADHALPVSHNIKHAPAHAGCQCDVVSGD